MLPLILTERPMTLQTLDHSPACNLNRHAPETLRCTCGVRSNAAVAATEPR